MKRSDACAEDRRCGIHVNRFWEMDAVRLIDNSIFCKETVRREPLEKLLASLAVEIVNHAAFAFETTANNVQKANSIAYLVTFLLDR